MERQKEDETAKTWHTLGMKSQDMLANTAISFLPLLILLYSVSSSKHKM